MLITQYLICQVNNFKNYMYNFLESILDTFLIKKNLYHYFHYFLYFIKARSIDSANLLQLIQYDDV